MPSKSQPGSVFSLAKMPEHYIWQMSHIFQLFRFYFGSFSGLLCNEYLVLFYDRRMANSRGHASAPISLLRNEYVFFPSPRIMGHHRMISNLQSPTKDLLIIDFYVSFVLKYQLARQGNNPKINFACMLW